MSDTLELHFLSDARVLHVRVLHAWSVLARSGARSAVDLAQQLHHHDKKDEREEARPRT